MYEYNPNLYFRAGPEALRCIRLAMLAGKVDSIGSVLDFASGGGRVLRTLVAAFPEAQFTASDMYPEGVQFCAEKLGATGVISDEDPAQVNVGGPFDLIWCGSLLTHVNRERLLGFVSMFESVLAPGGLAVFTVYGRRIVQELRDGVNTLDLEPDDIPRILRDYEQDGFGFSKSSTGGDTLVSRSWACARLDEFPSFDLLLYLEHGWLGQDVIAVIKRDPPTL